jgi:hypothetical protein
MIEIAALKLLRDIACKQGDQTLPTEDVIDIAQAVLCLYESLDKRLRECEAKRLA